MAGERILVVDDNVANLKLVSFVLAARGFEVLSAGDTAAARSIIDRERLDLVLMDVQLPGVDGLTFTRELRKNAATRELIVIAFTAYAMRGDEQKALDAGCNGYLTKPIDTRKFAEQVAAFLPVRA